MSQTDIRAEGASVYSLPETYTAYAYSYPHKSSYVPLEPPVPLRHAWHDEATDSLFLYVHLPFCEMRCGFCNLFTQAQPAESLVEDYLTTLDRQAHVVRQSLAAPRFTQLALGGGTPTHLTAAQLERLFGLLRSRLGAEVDLLHASVETSPATADAERLSLLAAHGVHRVSIGVQSFSEYETGALGRPQSSAAAHRALATIRDYPFPCLNVDLIYGVEGQTCRSWSASLRMLMRYAPEEIFLYPLYVRPQTGLARRGRSATDLRVRLYREGRDLLLAHGYRQLSMRCFRRRSYQPATTSDYQCQTDGMIGLGCGARSYTSRLHYSSQYAVTQAAVRRLIRAWIGQSEGELQLATHGFRMDEDECRRRFVLLSLLQTSGLDLVEYERRWEENPFERFPQLVWLLENGHVERLAGIVRLTAAGLEHSDAIAPMLYSDRVRRALENFAPP